MKKALAERDRDQGTDMTGAPRVTAEPRIVLSAQQKRERCRNCIIYCEHQRQKFAIASPLVVVAVIAGYAYIYGRLSVWLYKILEQTDRFMSFLTYRQGADSSFAAQGHTVTTLAMICLGVVLVSLSLRVVEYLIYELQV